MRGKKLRDDVRRGAELSACGHYRYALTREWDDSLDRVVWVLLNPSTADASRDDATVRRCMGYAASWGYGGIVIVNLFAYRARDPKALAGAYLRAGLVGPRNDAAIIEAVTAPRSGPVIAAWGGDRFAITTGRGRAVENLLVRYRPEVMCLRVTATGEPVHPLYQPACLRPVQFLRRATAADAPRASCP